MSDYLRLAEPGYQRGLALVSDWSPEDVVLRGNGVPALAGLDLRLLAEHLKLRRKAQDKLPSLTASPTFIVPGAIALEQASSEETARVKRRLLAGVETCTTLVDLSAGLGVDTLALAPAFADVIAVEQSAELAAVLQHNLTLKLPDQPASVVNDRAERIAFDRLDAAGSMVVYVDPSRRDASGGRVHSLEDGSPAVLPLLERLPGTVSTVLIKTAPRLDLSAALSSLAGLTDWRTDRIAIVARQGDCREVLYRLVRGAARDPDPRVECLHLTTNRTELWLQQWRDRSTPLPIGDVGRFFYDPNAALAKAEAAGRLLRRTGTASARGEHHAAECG